jgi:beta-lactamase superfamily II metal-dependent hydrolase
LEKRYERPTRTKTEHRDRVPSFKKSEQEEPMKNDNPYAFSRRRFITLTGAGVAAVAFAPRVLFAENPGIVPTMIADASKAKIEVYPLRRNISVLEGSGGNIAVLTGKDGKLLIDSGFAVSKPRIVRVLDNLSSDPITLLINTHWHVDHTDGNTWVHSAGAAILAHENTRKRLSTSTRVEAWDSHSRHRRQERSPQRYFTTSMLCAITTQRLI